MASRNIVCLLMITVLMLSFQYDNAFDELRRQKTPKQADSPIDKDEPDLTALDESHRVYPDNNTNNKLSDADLAYLLLQVPNPQQNQIGLCPGADICEYNKAFNIPKTPETDYYHVRYSCCTACSCSEDCQSNGFCCFQPDTEENTKENTTTLKSCYSTLYPTYKFAEQKGYRWYEMIDSVKMYDSGSLDDECGNAKVAPWGSLFPVYSKSKREIYKNAVCAKAHGVYDAIPFTATVTCFQAFMLFDNNLFTDDVWGNINDTCDVWFMFTGSAADEIRRHLCFPNVVNTCPDEFDNSYPIPRDTLIAACNSDFMSTYIGGRKGMYMYKNVFCAICNDDYWKLNCGDVTDIDREMDGFIAILEYEDFENFDRGFSLRKVNKQACLFRNDQKIEDTCRPVLCPKGQIITSDGSCRLTYMTWYDYRVLVYLHLNSDVPIDINGLEKSNIVPQWKNPWTIRSVYYFPTNISEPTVTNRIMVIISNIYDQVKPKYVHEIVSRFKHRKWMVETYNGTVSLTADFIAEEDRDDYVSMFNKSRLMKYIYHNRLRHEDQFIVMNELSVCDQVRLHPGEYGVHNTYTDINTALTTEVIYNNITGKLLYPGQFYYPISDPTQISVCLKMSGLELDGNRGHSREVAPYVLVIFLAITCYFNW